MNKLIRYDAFEPDDKGHKKAKELLATLTDRINKKIDFIYA